MLPAGSWQQHAVDLVLGGCSSIWLMLGLLLVHLCFRLTSPRDKPLPVFEGAAATPLPPAAPNNSQVRSVVVVTGGTGFLGSAIVRQLVQRGRSVCVVDRVLPSPERRVDGVACASTSSLLSHFPVQTFVESLRRVSLRSHSLSSTNLHH